MDGSEQMINMSQAPPSHTETDDHMMIISGCRPHKVPHISAIRKSMNSNVVFLFELGETIILYTMKLPYHHRFEISKYDYAVSEI